jgi:glyoxylase-like metal-dependent hydrolase (beta-lactamase superfamily II)
MIDLPDSMRVFERGWLSSNNVLFVDNQRTALIDSGYATHSDQTLALVDNALVGRSLDWLVNTHLHSDHCGGNARLQARFGCKTFIPYSEADDVRDWDEDALTFRATGQQCDRFAFDATIAPGDTLMLGALDWSVLGAPGHDPHSLMLYCASERLLLSADALWENGFGVIFPELEGDSGFAEQRAVLELIASLDIKTVIPGHGAPFSGVSKAIDTAFSRLDYLSADPARNAKNALKVLIVFKLMECRSMTFDTLLTLVESARVMRAAAMMLTPLEARRPALLRQLLAELEKGGVLTQSADAVTIV